MKKRDGEMTHGCDGDRGRDFTAGAGFDGDVRGDVSRATANWPDALRN